jgi:hypothetical protein
LVEAEYPEVLGDLMPEPLHGGLEAERRRPAEDGAGSSTPARPVEPEEPQDFFVSYTVTDQAWAEWITWQLEAHGYRCIFQKYDFRPGGNFLRAMHEASRRARRTLGILSPDYFRSKWATDEAFAAIKAERFVPLRVRDCSPDGLFGPIVYIDLVGVASEEQAIQKVLGGLEERRAKPLVPPVYPARDDHGQATPAAAPVFPQQLATQPVRVAVIAVTAELGRHAEAVADRLGRMGWAKPVEVWDAAAPPKRLPEAELWVVLLGARTGGTDLLTHALERDPVVAKLQAVDLSSIDLAHAAELPQALALMQRAAKAPQFSTPEEAGEAIALGASNWRRARRPGRATEAGVLSEWERAYLRQRLVRWERGTPGPVLSCGAAGVSLDLARLYVPLKADTSTAWAGHGGAVVFRRADSIEPPKLERGARPERDAPETRRVLLETALSAPLERYLVVEGEPGAGKTALLSHVAYVLAAVHLGKPEPAYHGLSLADLRGDALLLPIPLLLKASDLARRLGERDGLGGLVDALLAEVEAAIADRPEADLRAGLMAGRYLVLVDSLDEIPDQLGRQRVIDLFEGCAEQRFSARMVLTTRPSAYLGKVTISEALAIIRMAPLDEQDVRELVGRWCVAQSWDERYQADLLASLAETTTRYGPNLAENPLLLTATLLVHRARGRLPDSTAELYESIVQTLFLGLSRQICGCTT